MLNTFRNKIKFWSHVALWPVIVAFIAFYGWSFMGNQQNSPSMAAAVGDTSIDWQQVVEMRQRLYQMYRNMYKDSFEQFAKNMDFQQMAIDALIDRTILIQAAEEMGVTVSEDEIRNTILGFSYLQKDGGFSQSYYRAFLNSINMTPAQYEKSTGEDIMIEKVQALISASAPITNDELKEDFINKNVKLNCNFFSFKKAAYMNDITVEDSEAQDFYTSHPDDFKVGDQIQVDYILVEPATFEPQVEVTDEDIEDYYDQNYDQYQIPEQVKASHILFKVEKDAPQEKWDQALQKAIETKKLIDEGRDFAELAKERSEDTSADKGGDLGFFGKNRMVKEFEQTAWGLEIGQVSDPVKSNFGYHIIKKTDFQEEGIKSLDQVREDITKSLKLDESKNLAMQKAQQIFDQAEENTTLPDLASKNAIPVKTSDFFEPKMPPQAFGNSQNLNEVLTNLEKGDISIPIETNVGVFLFSLKDQRPSHVPPFDEIKDKVLQTVKNNKAKEMAQNKSQEILTDLRAGLTWEAAAEKHGLKSETTGEFTQTSSIPKVGYDLNLATELFAMDINQLSDPKEVRDSIFIFKVIDKKNFDETEFQKEMPKLRLQMASTRQSQIVSSWLDQRRESLTKEGKLIITAITTKESNS